MTTNALSLPGLSATGSKHDLLVEVTEGGFKFTVVGVGGKRHASANLTVGQGDHLAHFLGEHTAEAR